MDGDTQGNELHELYHTGLRNMHALEMTAIELTERQTERLENYPEMKAKLQEHHAESEQQARRLEVGREKHRDGSNGQRCGGTTRSGP
jgi:ferritin-like metal-binding protein YciE